MRPQDIVVGETYRLRHDRNIGFIKVIKMLKPKEDENTNSYTVCKCEHTIDKDGNFGFIRYFRPVDLVKD